MAFEVHGAIKAGFLAMCSRAIQNLVDDFLHFF
jgi:hypothetical protein